MNLLEMITKSGDGAVIGQIAGQLGIGREQARDAAAKMLPSLARGMQKNTSSSSGLGDFLAALQKGRHGRYLDDPSQLADADAIADGNAILGHLFGSKDVSRNVASHAAKQTGVGSEVLKRMLPMLAAAAMGAMAKQTSGGGALSELQKQGTAADSGALGALAGFLDADKDGSIADDLLGMAKKFF